MQKRTLIWVDDEREVPSYRKESFENIIVCKTYKQAVSTLIKFFSQKNPGSVIVDLDHDLQCKKTGYDLAKFIVNFHLPISGFCCHSLNVVGKENIEALLAHYGYKIWL